MCVVKNGVVLLLLASSGCGRQEAGIDARRSERVDAVVQSEASGVNGYRQAESILDEIVAVTNVKTRIECLTAFADALLAARLDARGYRQWDRSLSAIPSLVRSVCNGLSWYGADIEQVYDMRLKLLSWHQRQLETLEKTRPNEKALSHDEAQIVWRRCRERVSASQGMTLDLLESRFDDETRTLAAERRDAIRRRIEAFLGRPLRSAASVRKERRRETDAMRMKKDAIAPLPTSKR